MKKIILGFFLLLLPLSASSAWLFNPHTGKLDYYEAAGTNLTFDQGLNTTNNTTHVNITSTGFFLGNGSQLTGISPAAGNPFDQVLNKTSNVIFATVNATTVNSSVFYQGGKAVLNASDTGAGLTAVNGLNVSDLPKGFIVYNLSTVHKLAFWEMASAATITSVNASTVGLSAANFTVEEWNSTGTGFVSVILNSTGVAANTKVSSTSFNDSSVAAGNFLYFNCTGAGSNSTFTLKIK